jgi:hypothetical protein
MAGIRAFVKAHRSPEHSNPLRNGIERRSREFGPMQGLQVRATHPETLRSFIISCTVGEFSFTVQNSQSNASVVPWCREAGNRNATIFANTDGRNGNNG